MRIAALEVLRAYFFRTAAYFDNAGFCIMAIKMQMWLETKAFCQSAVLRLKSLTVSSYSCLMDEAPGFRGLGAFGLD